MNWIDLLILLLLAAGAFRGVSTGVVRQVLGLIGLVLAFALGIQLMTPVGRFLEGTLGIGNGFGPVLGFVLVFLCVIIGLRVLSRMVESLLKVFRLSTVNRVVGGLFGAFQAALLLSLFFLVLAEVGLPAESTRDAAQLYDPIASVLPATWDAVAGQWPQLKQVSTEFGARIEEQLSFVSTAS